MRFPISVANGWGPILAVFGMSPSQSFVDVDERGGTMRVKAGVWFDETFALRDVASVEPSSWPWYGGLGVKLGPGNAVSVVASKRGVVAVHFHRPQRMHVLVVVERPELRLSLEDPDAFMRALRDAIASSQQQQARA